MSVPVRPYRFADAPPDAHAWGLRLHRIAMVAILLLAAVPLDLSAQDGSPLAERLSWTVADRMDRDDVPGVVIALLVDGGPVWTGVFGMADPATGRALTEDAVFRVESLSKPVTAWGAMRLAETARLDLDASVKQCLTRWQPPDDAGPITPRQLLSQSAGVGLGDFAARYPPDAQRPDLPDHLAADFTRVAGPGERFAYSDTGFNLLELVIEDCTGEDFAVLMSREALAPLGMTRASFDWPGAEMPVGHDLRGRPVAPYVYPGRASGGLHATVADIARFAAAGMDGADQDVLSPEAVGALHGPVVSVGGLFGLAADGYGLGHFTETLSDGRTAVWHGGQGHGWMSHMHIVPETGDGIVILSNSQRAWPLFAAVLRDWSDSLGVAPVGMARVLWAETAARIAIPLLVTASAIVLWIAYCAWSRPPVARIGAGLLSAPLALWPVFAATQDYLFLFSILPGLWPWLAAASCLTGFSLAVFALAPARRG
ncbi:serine hydrolase domain-containing protein [Palleronia sp. KMU-117]|uniref:serine hydrolase domain-containing protein n=1 Tax=Palleronia sp. KMU-117 TaxID=3434108 RepID=UPI003D740626